MLLILLVLLLIVLVWNVFKPRRPSRSPEKKARASETKKTGGWFNRLKAPFQKKPRQELAWLFDKKTRPASLENRPSEPNRTELSAWLTGLSDAAATQLANDLAAFVGCYDLELNWSTDEKIISELRIDLEELVMLYSRAARQAGRLQALAALQHWQAAPLQPENRNFARQLFAGLVSAGLASAPGELLLASDKERESHVGQAIQSALVENRAAVLALLTEIFAAEEAVKTAQPKTRKKTKKSLAVTGQTVAEA